MWSRLGVLTVLLVMLSSMSVNAAKPNVLFILADDQRPDSIGAYGNEHIKTPNIDSLIHNGFSFRRNYCMGSQHGAVCQPSRAMMMSGQAYFRIPMDLKGVTTFPEHLRTNGYSTFVTGKWHNNAPAILRSFENGKNIMMGGMSNHIAVPLQDISKEGTLINKRTGEEFSSKLFADAAIEFIKQQNSVQPFMAYVCMTSPHDPRQPSLEYRQPYYDAKLPLPENFMPQHPFDNDTLIIRDENLAAWPREPEIVRDQLAEYYGLITHMDDQIGLIITTLKEKGFYENTVIVYAADHGLAVGSHGLLGKQSLYEHSMGAPLAFVGPGIPKGQSSTALSYLLDIFPTVCDAIDLPLDLELDGKSLKPIWQNRVDTVRDKVFLSYKDNQRALVQDRWKLIRYSKINHTQLFDLKNDPHELNNLAKNADHTLLKLSLMTQLKEQQKQYGDKAKLEVSTPKPFYKDLTGTERKPDRHQPKWIVKKYFD